MYTVVNRCLFREDRALCQVTGAAMRAASANVVGVREEGDPCEGVSVNCVNLVGVKLARSACPEREREGERGRERECV